MYYKVVAAVGMRQVPVRELNEHTADVLARVEIGERVEITRDGVTVAIIEPAQSNPLSELIESGDLRPPRGPLRLLWPADGDLPRYVGRDEARRPEAHSNELSDWLAERRERTVLSSVLIEVELVRATRRSAPERLHRAAEVLRGIGVVTLAPSVVARAAAYTDSNRRSVDAIHVATAEHVVSVTREQLDAFVAYDDRLLATARSVGLPAIAHGTIIVALGAA